MSQRLAAIAFVLPLIGLVGCKKHGSSCGAKPDHSVIACVGDEAVGRSEVSVYVRKPLPVPGKARLPDPRMAATEAALRVRLFAREAKRRGLHVSASTSAAIRRGRLNRALIVDELKRRGISAAAVTDAEAGGRYKARPGRFNKIHRAYCRAIFVRDAATAEAVYKRVKGADDARFASVAREVSVDPSAADGGDIGEIHRPGIDPDVRTLGNTLHAVGEIGGPVELLDRRFVILLVSRLEMTVRPFAGQVVAMVKNAMVHERSEVALDELYRRLRAKANIRVFAAAVKTLR